MRLPIHAPPMPRLTTRPMLARTLLYRRVTRGGSARSPLHWYYTADHYESFCEFSG